MCALILFLAYSLPAQDSPEKPSHRHFVYIDLQPKANDKLSGDYGIPGNTRLCFPQGHQTLKGVRFKIQEGFIQVGSKLVREFPLEVQGIMVEEKLTNLHILHATGYSVPDGTLIGEYMVRYDDGSEEGIPIVYGDDVRDWWNWDRSKPVKRGKVAWTGANDAVKRMDMDLRLYLTTWENPKPDRKVVSIDYRSTGETAAAPFCIAITAERTAKGD